METMTIIGLAAAAVIVVACVGIAVYKWVFSTRADLTPRNDE